MVFDSEVPLIFIEKEQFYDHQVAFVFFTIKYRIIKPITIKCRIRISLKKEKYRIVNIQNSRSLSW